MNKIWKKKKKSCLIYRGARRGWALGGWFLQNLPFLDIGKEWFSKIYHFPILWGWNWLVWIFSTSMKNIGGGCCQVIEGIHSPYFPLDLLLCWLNFRQTNTSHVTKRILQTRKLRLSQPRLFLWLPEKENHFVFTWPFLHFLTLLTAIAAKLLSQFKSDLEFKCVSHLGLHRGHTNFPRQPPSF